MAQLKGELCIYVSGRKPRILALPWLVQLALKHVKIVFIGPEAKSIVIVWYQFKTHVVSSYYNG